ncbi:hypothetical protein HDU84_002340 [Entophlyctis sp. JEL0112]|nr:hypothetical protein HDU84_002340 [Entophlyctis sp. JEL0112]
MPIPLPPAAAATPLPAKPHRLSPVPLAVASAPHHLIPPAAVAVAVAATSVPVRPTDFVLYSASVVDDPSTADFALRESNHASVAAGDATIMPLSHIVIGTAPPVRPSPTAPKYHQPSFQQNRPRPSGRPRLGCLIERDRPSLDSLTLVADDIRSIQTATAMI